MTTSSRYDERTRGVTLRVLDFTKILAEEGLPLEEGERAHLGFEPYAAAEHNGQLYVVCNEGVGWKVSEDEPLRLDIFVDHPDTIAIFPRWQLLLPPDAVRSAMTDEETDLADLIRSFGFRLESNFWTLYRELTR